MILSAGFLLVVENRSVDSSAMCGLMPLNEGLSLFLFYQEFIVICVISEICGLKHQLSIPARSLRCSSSNCSLLVSEGAPVRRQAAFWVLGKAMTSRMDASRHNSMTSRSNPIAIPPWGGAPESRADSRKPNLAS